MNDRLSGISAFVQAVEAGSFAQAAERMHVTRSAVGKSIARLEERLGVRLFQRTTRTQRLTLDGEAYYERCVRALSELEAADAALDSGRREPTGLLRVSCPVLFGRRCVAPVLVKFADQHAGLTLEISFSDRVVDLVGEGYDLAVRIGELGDSGNLTARKLGTQSMGIGASPAYLARRGTPRSVDELSQHVAIQYASRGEKQAWPVRDADGSLREVRLETRLMLDDLEAMADAAAAGVGVTRLPCWLLSRYMRAGQLEVVMTSEYVMPTGIYAVWPTTRYLPSKTRAAIDVLAAEIPKLIS